MQAGAVDDDRRDLLRRRAARDDRRPGPPAAGGGRPGRLAGRLIATPCSVFLTHRRHRDPRRGARGAGARREDFPGCAAPTPRRRGRRRLPRRPARRRARRRRAPARRAPGVAGGRRDAARASASATASRCSLLGGEAEPDAELAELSLAPAGAVAQAFEYLRHGGVENTRDLLRFLADTFGCSRATASSRRASSPTSASTCRAATIPPSRARPPARRRRLLPLPPRGREHGVRRRAVRRDRGRRRPAAVRVGYSLRRRDGARALELLDGQIDALITTVLAVRRLDAGTRGRRRRLACGGARPRSTCPVIQARVRDDQRARRWAESDAGLTPLDARCRSPSPSSTGASSACPSRFKEPLDGDVALDGVCTTRRTPSAATRLARLAVRPRAAADARPRPSSASRSCSRPSRPSTRGSATRSGSTRRPARSALLDALRDAGLPRRARLRRRRRAHPRADRRRRPRPRVPHRRRSSRGAAGAAAGRRLRAPGSRRCPTQLRDADGRARGARRPASGYVDGGDFVLAGLDLGNVFVAIQPPRGYGENPVAIYHDPDLAPAAPLPRRLPLAATRSSAPTRSSTSASTARSSGCRARRSGSSRRVLARRLPRRRAALLPVRRQRPRRGHAGQAPRPRRDRSTTSCRR